MHMWRESGGGGASSNQASSYQSPGRWGERGGGWQYVLYFRWFLPCMLLLLQDDLSRLKMDPVDPNRFPFKYSQKRKCYFQNRIIMFCLPVPRLIDLWEIYIFPGLVCLFCCREICGLILGIYKSLTDTWMWKLGLRPRNSQKRNS